ncbi:hypothetical protein SDC9_108650 [bioreactor metagenome]|uniref:Uncharacterized protein n=1 Tax=bioreactor metagenome TaxID=1076179 RepID=A0A645B8L8_9ZZZZ
MVRIKDRIRIGHRSFRIDGRIIFVHGNPRGACRKSAVGRSVPLHRAAGIVAAFGIDGSQDICFGIAFRQALVVHIERFDVPCFGNISDRRIGHADLFALIDVGRAFHHVQQNRQHFGAFRTVFLVISPARKHPRQIVVVPEQGIPAVVPEFGLPFRQNPFQFGDFHRLQIPFLAVRFLVQADMLELENHRQFVALRSGIQFSDFRSRSPGFADGQ